MKTNLYVTFVVIYKVNLTYQQSMIREEITNECPFCGIGTLQYKQLSIIEYVDDDDD